jgi:hypothetical protein
MSKRLKIPVQTKEPEKESPDVGVVAEIEVEIEAEMLASRVFQDSQYGVHDGQYEYTYCHKRL